MRVRPLLSALGILCVYLSGWGGGLTGITQGVKSPLMLLPVPASNPGSSRGDPWVTGVWSFFRLFSLHPLTYMRIYEHIKYICLCGVLEA